MFEYEQRINSVSNVFSIINYTNSDKIRQKRRNIAVKIVCKMFDKMLDNAKKCR